MEFGGAISANLFAGQQVIGNTIAACNISKILLLLTGNPLGTDADHTG